jgi:putative nucleotidyltransferase with HDIG domain
MLRNWPQAILVVDDSPSVTSRLREVLIDDNYQVFTAANGREALDIIMAQDIGVILCDLQMPRMDGKKLRQKLLTHEKYSQIPFVAMSANATTENFKAMRQMKAAAFLVKPFRTEQLSILLSRIQDEARRQKSSEKKLNLLEKKLLLKSIMRMAEALDARDFYTRSHSDSVSRIATKIAQHMGFDKRDIELIFIAGRLHDLGKIGIKDNILQKPGPLTEEEFAVIKTHPEVGARIIGVIPSLKEVADIIHCHHERLDGRGYPQGLKGGEISILASILSIADVYDALMSDRPYRKALAREESLAIMADGRESRFHPECLDAFFEILKNGKLDYLQRQTTHNENFDYMQML